MKKYVVMTNYGMYEGWAISGEADEFDEAVKIREKYLSNGNSEVMIFRPVLIKTSEIETDDPPKA